jgi:hypothetical protein
MSDQFQQTCSICAKTFQGFITDTILGLPLEEVMIFHSNHELTGKQCVHCGADVCKSCDPKVGFLATLLKSKKSTCPKCGKPEWAEKSYFMYSGVADVKKINECLENKYSDGWNHKDELLALMAKCSDQVVKSVFDEVQRWNQGNELLKLGRMAQAGWLDPFKDGKIEGRLLEATLNHPSDDVKYHACITLIQLEDILHTDRAIPVLLHNLKSEDITFYNTHIYIIKALASSLPALGSRNDVIDICVEALHSNIDYWDLRLIAEKLPLAVGIEKGINEKIVGGLALALKQRANGPLKDGSLASYETPIGIVAAESLGNLGAVAMDAVPALIQALRQGGLGLLISGSNVWTDALCSITGMNFSISADEWQAWWKMNH